jgi:ribosomal protein S18 acetylase RimI-like enzyme
MILREARTEDRPALVGFMTALQDFERGMEPNRLPGAEMADRHLAALEAWAQAHPGGGLLVAEVEGSLAGFIIFGVEEEFGTYVPEETQCLGRISDLWVKPGTRGRGIARALIAAAEKRFRTAGLARSEVTAVHGNSEALRLYKALGYCPYHVTLAKKLGR